MDAHANSILFMCSALDTGGAERQWSILLPALAERGFEPRLTTLVRGGRFFDEIQRAGIRCSCIGMRSRYDVLRAFAALRATEPVALVVTQEVNAHVLGHVCARRFGVPHIAIDHTPPGLRPSTHRRLLTRLVARRVDYGVAVSDAQLPDLGRLGFRQDRLAVISNGVPRLSPTQGRAGAREALGVGDNEFLALMVATLRPQKRARFFIDAVVHAHAVDDAIRGVIAGGGPELDNVRSYARPHGHVVEVLGERQDVANLIEACDALCLTSWTEGLPMVLLEAMSLGAVIVATDVPGNRELVMDGQTGLLTPADDPAAFADALLRLRASPSLSPRLRRCAKRRYESSFTAERMVQQYAELFRAVISE